MLVFWHRRDLRVADNLGLAAASTAAVTDKRPAEGDFGGGESEQLGPVLPVFCFDDQILSHAGGPRVSYMLDALRDLREQYRSLGSDLVVRSGDASAVIPDVADQYDADRVVWNHDYSGLAEERDDAVRATLSDDGIRFDEFHDGVLHEPGTFQTTAGDPYQVYAYYWKKWRDHEKADLAPVPEAETLADVTNSRELPTHEELGFERPSASLPSAGTGAARRRLDNFLESDVYRYETDRDIPAADATSRLSQDLKFGTIGIREVHKAVMDALEEATDSSERESVRTFESQLAWREFYTQVLYHNPSVVTENFSTYQHPIEWRNDPEELAAWKAGETGYPIVDAGMRQLKEEAYMHNRVRMIVASFLTKDLCWDWRAGYDHFRRYLVDHDTANDNGGWQWAASTGTDAQPYFRVFNPQTQGERHDPDARYIKRYIPELEAVPPATVHSWPDLSPKERTELAPEYPAPIVDHQSRREEAIAMFEKARGDS